MQKEGSPTNAETRSVFHLNRSGLDSPKFSSVPRALRLVEDDTAALRSKCFERLPIRVEFPYAPRMTFLPIVDRELRVAARRGGTYWMRMGAALVGIVVGTWIWLMMLRENQRQMGFAIFVGLSIFSCVYCLLAGLRTTADCLSEEKREGTLGLLFLTDLKGYDVVFGKLAATSLSSFYGLLAIFPVMGIPLLLGGVAPGEFWRIMLVCVNTLFFSLAIGMFCSSICRDAVKGTALAFAIILMLTMGLPGIGGLLVEKYHLPLPPKICFITSPGYDCFMAFDEPRKHFANFEFFYESVLVVHLISWAALLAACVIVPRSWQDKAADASGARWSELRRRWGQGTTEVRASFRLRLLEINPFYWLAARDSRKNFFVWLFLLAVAGVWGWGLIVYPDDWPNPGSYVVTALLLHSVLKNWLASMACRRFAADRHSGALELLLATPISVREILRGQRLALWRQFAGPALVVAVVDFGFLFAGLYLSRHRIQDPEWPLVWLAGVIIFVWDLFALGWVGMWLGLCSRNGSRAAGATLVRICVLPWLAFALLVMCIALLEEFFKVPYPRWFNNGVVPVILWFVLSAANNLLFAGWAKRKLLAEFRTVATSRFESKTSAAWGRWLRELFTFRRS